ncbi:MAG TPA: outer membrane lipoprotein-sorting protein [Candidatus Angelobacter sp.]
MLFRFTLWGILLSMLAAVAAVAQVNATQQNANSVKANSIVDAMLKAQQENKARVKPFTVKRGYLLLDKQEQEKAKMVASITVLPPDAKEYQIESSSGGMGANILRDVLTKETEQPKDADRKELSRNNYDFKLLGEEALNGRRCYLLGLNPKREEKDLLRGKLWVDSETYNILRIEGSPVKSPSWWIHDVNILMSFAEVDGMWLRTSTHAVANVRFKGKYIMDSRDLEYSFTQETASRGPVTRRYRANPAIFAGSAIRP